MAAWTHMDENGRPTMVNVSEKTDTTRRAVAGGSVYMAPETLAKIKDGGIQKGDVLSVAQTAGIMAAKETARAIPMCHNLFLAGVAMDFTLDTESAAIHITADAEAVGKTGVEMEALYAVSVAALTIYDMCKAVDKGMRIADIRLLHKTGGRSGCFVASGAGAIVASINVSAETGTVKSPVREALFLAGKGIAGDAHCGLDAEKQVSLLAEESADKIRKMGLAVSAGAFAENITTKGIDLHTLPVGAKLRIGETLQAITRIGKDCHNSGCAIKRQTGTCVMPTEGVFARVLVGGAVRVGDGITVLPQDGG